MIDENKNENIDENEKSVDEIIDSIDENDDIVDVLNDNAYVESQPEESDKEYVNDDDSSSEIDASLNDENVETDNSSTLEADDESIDKNSEKVAEVNDSSDSDEIVKQDSIDSVDETDYYPDDEEDDSNLNLENNENETNVDDLNSKVNDYFNDDEAFLAGDDVELHDGDTLSIFQQDENVVSVEILNLYTPEGNLRSRFALRSDPPLLEIKSNDGQIAQFVLTKNFAHGLLGKFDDAYSAYYGVESKSSRNRKKKKRMLKSDEKLTFKDHVVDGMNWVQDNKFKSAIGIIVVLLILFGLFF